MMLAICLWIKKRMVEDIEFESIRVAPARFKRTVFTKFHQSSIILSEPRVCRVHPGFGL